MALPLSGVYKQRQLDAEEAHQGALQALQGEERQGYQDYGYQSTDQGPQLDPSMRHGLAQNMMRGHADSLHALRDQLVGQHLGTYGLAAKRGQLMRFTQQGERGDLGSRFQRMLNDIINKRREALTSKTREFTSAEQDAAQFAAQQNAFAPAGGGGTDYPPGTNPGVDPSTGGPDLTQTVNDPGVGINDPLWQNQLTSNRGRREPMYY